MHHADFEFDLPQLDAATSTGAAPMTTTVFSRFAISRSASASLVVRSR